MQISRRVTNGLAWAGLFIVVGVPSADIITAQFMGERETIGSAVAGGAPIVLDVGEKPRLDQTTTASVDEDAVPTAPTPAPAPQRTQVAETSADPVDQYLQSGRKLPSYISGGEETATAPQPQPVAPSEPAEVAATPAPQPVQPTPAGAASEPTDVAAVPQPGNNATVTAPARPPAAPPIEVAAIDPNARIAPVPMPLSMRPTPRSEPTIARTEPVVIPSSVQAPASGYPVAPPQAVAGYGDVVTAEELEDWESGPLSEFLRQRGGGRIDPDYDPNGFFLDQGPNSRADYRREPPPIVSVYPLY
ncbi:hypothetical protein VE25_07060 [Devosia geojensis]|uniref:Uncharacterized protein n=1 Tax=Devosia geojensis TaxID=443610 RepID=A0A0F5FV82_9HYPH|nr:hypothetical protein [Devosia geojensis]KKB12485.1 hypothetical protein VE25_07060 [Devosia geojensis]